MVAAACGAHLETPYIKCRGAVAFSSHSSSLSIYSSFTDDDFVFSLFRSENLAICVQSLSYVLALKVSGKSP